MNDMWIVVGIYWYERNGTAKLRKKYVAVSPDKYVAAQIARYMNEKNDKYDYHIDMIDTYDNFGDFIFFNGFDDELGY